MAATLTSQYFFTRLFEVCTLYTAWLFLHGYIYTGSTTSVFTNCITSYRTVLISILALLPLLGGTWILGLLFLFDSDSEPLAWIFTILNSMQVYYLVSVAHVQINTVGFEIGNKTYIMQYNT